ncbi:voltage-gated potassium channel [Metschnikowia bicuspidata]|uniref:Voltage-gated potassium channel n=1 Tax=Metschnikowia bicuspidata TaxID=27322 RepID=A0A4P9ZJJ7_9ASCO|nr:voltage-gated potassium channel [Metschnikowia bicuspidata]
MSLLFIFFLFLVFWLVGALIFSYIEGWRYFDALHFCFVTLLTIGYGDYHPTWPLGRAFWVPWAFFAVPLMTVLISNAADMLFTWCEPHNCGATYALHWRTYWRILRRFYRRRAQRRLLGKTRIRNLLSIVNSDYDTFIRIVNRIESMKVLLVHTMDSPDKRYTHDEWSEHLDALDVVTMSANDPQFWLGENSRFRHSIKEPSFLFFKVLMGVKLNVFRLFEVAGRDHVDFVGTL